MIITILRKPLEGSVAENTLKHGCGALNIDDTRIGSLVQDTSKNGHSFDKQKGTVFQSGFKKDFEGKTTTGRWPANFILTHLEGCELRGTKKVKSNGNHTYKTPQDGGTIKLGLKNLPSKGNPYADADRKEEVLDWVCVEGCPVQELDRQSGVSKSTGGRIGNAQGVYSNQGRTGWGTGHTQGDPGFGDEGGASRFFKQFKKDNNQ
jgi:hypothetical protein